MNTTDRIGEAGYPQVMIDERRRFWHPRPSDRREQLVLSLLYLIAALLSVASGSLARGWALPVGVLVVPAAVLGFWALAIVAFDRWQRQRTCQPAAARRAQGSP